MPSGFIHAVKVPRLYKTVAKIVKGVRENGSSLKSLIYNRKHPNVSAIYALCLNTLQNEAQLNHLLTETSILVNEPRLDPWLAKVLIIELIWRKKTLNSECKPVKTILSYEEQLREAFSRINEVEGLEASNRQVRKPRYVRVNTLLLPLTEAIDCFKDEGWFLLPKCSTYTAQLEAVKNLKKPNFIQDFHVPELLVFPPDTTFHDHLGYQNGEFVLQDKASCLPAQLLSPKPGSEVLDMCAAPGMKCSHLAALMNNLGKIYAVEMDKRRYTTLCEQMKLTSASCVETINKDSLTLESDEYSNVEYVLVDPTCSGSGSNYTWLDTNFVCNPLTWARDRMFEKRKTIGKMVSRKTIEKIICASSDFDESMLDRQLVNGEKECPPERLKQLQAFQVFLLRHALLNFPKVKRVVYSTCSNNEEENEQVIDEILDKVGDTYKLVSIKAMYKDNWMNYSSKSYKCSDKCLYAKSDVDFCNGFFVAMFERNFDVPLPEYKFKGSNANDEQTEKNESSSANEEEKSFIKKNKKRRPKRKNVSSGSVKIVEKSNQGNRNDSVETVNEPPAKKTKMKKQS